MNRLGTILVNHVKIINCIIVDSDHVGAFSVLKGQSHEKVGEMSAWAISLGPN
jgi:hypothetical protein